MRTYRIRTRAEKLKISDTYICKELGVSPGYLDDFDRNPRDIPEGRLKKIADILNTTVEYLKGEDEPEDEKKSVSERRQELEEEYTRLIRVMSFEQLKDFKQIYDLVSSGKFVLRRTNEKSV
jgi:transcriptional regulator with XRE-family HTH domain